MTPGTLDQSLAYRMAASGGARTGADAPAPHPAAGSSPFAMPRSTRLARRPVVGVTTQTLQAIAGIPEGIPASWVMNQRYFRAVTELGAVPWMIPLLADEPDVLRGIYEHLDALLIPGGVDMDPATYGEDLTPEVGRLDPARDAVELQLARWAIADGMPILGLCRGAQVINVSQGGSLVQDIPTQFDCPDPAALLQHDCYPTKGFARTHLAHEVALTPGSRLRDLFERRDAVPVNSMHHQSVKRLGAGLRVSAVAPDGVVEAVEGTGDAFCVGVQWHPEVFELHDPATRQLFRSFLGEAERFARAA